MSILVSIIVPVYNTKISYLEKCIESILKQTYQKYELIIVNDGSTNNEIVTVCEKYEEKDNRIKVYHKKNEGVSIARNYGLEKSTGNLITFVDADDWIEKNYLEYFVNQYEENRCNILLCDRIFEYNKISCDTYFFDCEKILTTNEREELISLTIKTGIGGAWCKLYEKDFLLRNQLKYIPHLKRTQDVIFNLYAFQYCKSVHYLHKCLYHYRMNELSVTKKYNENALQDLSKTIFEFEKFVKTYYPLNPRINNDLYLKKLNIATEIMKLNYFHKLNRMTWKETKKELSLMFDDDLFKDMIKKIDFKQLNWFGKIKIFLIRGHLFFLLKLFFKLQDLIRVKKLQ